MKRLVLAGVLVGTGLALTRRKIAAVVAPVVGRITSGFGPRTHPVTGEAQFHDGIDVGVSEGTPVKAPFAGSISRVWTDDINGSALRVKMDGGSFEIGFAHLSKVLVQEGWPVKVGDTVALSGNTGRSTGPHLHMTLRDAGQVVDPAQFFSAQGAQVGV